MVPPEYTRYNVLNPLLTGHIRPRVTGLHTLHSSKSPGWASREANQTAWSDITVIEEALRQASRDGIKLSVLKRAVRKTVLEKAATEISGIRKIGARKSGVQKHMAFRTIGARISGVQNNRFPKKRFPKKAVTEKKRCPKQFGFRKNGASENKKRATKAASRSQTKSTDFPGSAGASAQSGAASPSTPSLGSSSIPSQSSTSSPSSSMAA